MSNNKHIVLSKKKPNEIQDIIIILQNEMVTSGVGNLIHVKDTDWKFVYVIVVCGTVITNACPNQDTQRRRSP